MPYLGYPLSKERGVIYYNERHTLLLKCFITFFGCIRKVLWLSEKRIYKPLMCQTVTFDICIKIGSQITYKKLDLGNPLCTGNGMICYEERHTLLMKWLITFLRCMTKVWGASKSIYKPFSVQAVPFHWGQLSNWKLNVGRFGIPFLHKNGVLWYKERYPLLPKWFKTFLWCMGKVGWASDSIYKPQIVHIELCQLRLTLKLHTKYQIIGTLSWRGMACYAARRGIHCCWSVS